MKKYIYTVVSLMFFISSFFTNLLKAEAYAQIPNICCSSVLFIPGVEGSRLYTSGFLSENQLWEPNQNADVEKLYLDTNGKSLNQNIYTRDIITSTNYPAGNIDVYKSFAQSMDRLVSSSTISEWQALPYDWRFDYKDIIADGIKTSSTSTVSVISIIEDLASRSYTGRVTLVTHSNGGLLAKAIIEELEKEDKAYLIDNLILVAVPQLGTPQSLAAVLHGYGQNIFNGIFMNSSVARTLSENMPTAYNLLPSEKYIEKTNSALIKFNRSIDSISNLRTLYGDVITSSSTLRDFMLAVGDGRAKPASSDLTIPNVLNSGLISNSNLVHQDLDNWTVPQNINVSQIVGFGLDTVTGIEYGKKTITVCTPICYQKDVLDYQPTFDFHGDGVVMKQSADDIPTQTYYVNLAGINFSQKTNRSHSDILEMPTVQDLVSSIISKKQIDLSDGVTYADAENLPTIQNSLRVSIHSPVSINLYDAEGRHTGPIANENSDLTFYEAKIPNSYYMPFGEGVYVGVENPSTTTIALEGTAVGSFTLEIDKTVGDATTSTVFEDVPVLLTTTANIVVTSATSTSLVVDVDGDGKNDFAVSSNQPFDPISYLKAIQSLIYTFDLNKRIENQLDNKIQKIITLIQDGKITAVNKKIKSYLHNLKLVAKHTKINLDDQNLIINMLNNLLDNLN